MRLLILSDLHLEFGAFQVPDVEFDVAILAGDIAVPATKAIAWIRRATNFGETKPVIFVPGNHEFYADVLSSGLANMQRAAAGTNVYALDCGEAIIGGVRFLGCTLWTDFALRIDTPDGLKVDVERAAGESGTVMSDYRAIRILQSRGTEAMPSKEKPFKRALRPADTIALHQAHRKWLRQKLNDPFEGPTVVVTHHAPHRGSLSALYASDWVSGAFVSELRDHFFEVPVLWVHGHTHTSFDYKVDNCRVVCNPRGYMLGRSRASNENEGFNPALVVEVS
ncbi:Predicted phosphohydrolases [Variovorax sp. HW608]|uniref:metallophosphoesterase n=1 Tax=Variovorax sp. HW608 TaxID=1034889 RepID=UPI00082002DB|nr:metallophosphoesterase [Variovorax sp. HW608]SCK38082.1 Predicted phosphohydrolases [Variovorax sp. HW608]